MHQSLLDRGLSMKAMTLGVFAGVNAALPMYLWQSNMQLAMACFIVVGYTVWLWAATAGQMAMDFQIRHYLMSLPMNAWHRRLGRMLAAGGFWWSLLFGCAIVTGSAWYVDIRTGDLVGGIAAGWAMVAILLNYGLTLECPSTRCRKCHYQLAPHFDIAGVGQRVRCPECGSRWSKVDLGLAPTPERSAKPRKPLRERSRQRRRSTRSVAEPISIG